MTMKSLPIYCGSPFPEASDLAHRTAQNVNNTDRLTFKNHCDISIDINLQSEGVVWGKIDSWSLVKAQK